MTKRQQEIVSTYRNSASLRKAAAKLGTSMQYVHETVQRFAPELMNAPYLTAPYRSSRTRNRRAA